jgi:hypothetical protein
LAVPTRTAADGEGHNHPIAGFELLVVAADLADLAHALVAKDIATLHPRDEAAVQVEVRAADGAGGHSDDRIAAILDLGVGDGLAADIATAVPSEGLHQ